QLEPAVKLLRDARRQLRPGFVCRRHLRRLGLRARTTPTPATAANRLHLRTRSRIGSLLVRHLRGNGLRRTTRTTGAPLPTRLATTATAVPRLRLPRKDAAEQRLDRRAHFSLNEVPDH